MLNLNKIFFSSGKNNEELLTYNWLLDFLSSDEQIITNYREVHTGILLAHFLKAICYSIDFTLLDQNLSKSELAQILEEEYEETAKPIIPKNIRFEEIQEYIRNSSSKITLFTSGTTGQPKKVIHKLESLIRETRTGNNYVDNVWGLAYNPTHMAGLQVFFQAIMNGNSIINLYKIEIGYLSEAISQHAITHISATPTFFRLLGSTKHQFNSVKRVSLGGEKSGPELHRNLAIVFPNAKFTNIYASTEAGTLLASKGDLFYIPQDKKNLIKIENQEILVNQQLLAGNIQQITNWYPTGDLIEWENEDQISFRIVGRVNELINVGGMKVNPSEIEEEICKFPGIRQALVFGKSNSVVGTLLCANVVVSQSENWQEYEIKAFLRSKLQPHKIPRKFYLVDEVAVGRTGKISRKQNL